MYNLITLRAESGEPYSVQFARGAVPGRAYRLGDRISWADAARPAAADGVVQIAGIGVWVDGAERTIHGFEHYRITLHADRIVGVEGVEAAEYETLKAAADALAGLARGT
jgi:hypothetical protein